ncbi:hypothetical protein [Niabella aquatica]
MKNIFLLILGVMSATLHSISQNIDNKLIEWTKINPVEKLYLQLDRESYFSGQTIWFKGYFMSNFVPSGKSSTLYVELVNNRSDIIVRGIFPAYLSTTLGQLDVPENTPAGTYQLRAYSPLMMNQPGFIFYKRITISGKEARKKEISPSGNNNQLLFFPEGGNMISNLMNVIAFKATDKNGLPMNITGEIMNNTGAVITTFKTMHDGMGSFPLLPIEGDSYFATIAGSEEKYPLPQQTKNGILFSVRSTAQGKQFRIQTGSDEPAFKPAYMIGQMENEIMFRQPFRDGKKEINGLIPTNNFYSGILHLTVFNKDDMPLAERITFIDNRDYILPGELRVDTLDTDARKRNHFSILLPDTVIGNFSISVTDADYENETTRPQNIYSWFLLNSDIKGYVHNPSYYFSSESEMVKNTIDLVMMTNGWTRFKWTDVAQNKLPPPRFKDPGYISLKGRVMIEGTKKPLENKDIIVMMRPVDSTLGKNSVSRFMHTDSSGYFNIDSMIFYDKMRILFSDVRGKKSKFITVKLDGDSLTRKYNIPPITLPFDSSETVNTAKMMSAYNDYNKAAGLTLENVTVKARQKTEQEKLDEQYASGLFAGGINGRTLDLRNENYSGSIFQYLQGRIAGLTVSGTPGNYVLSFRGGGFGGSNVSLFLDEIPTDASMIESISVNEIAMVKLLPNSVATPGGGTVLAIYMKKGIELSASLESPTDIITYNGYTVVKEFYNPDYDKQPGNEKADNRLTMAWYPTIFVADVNPKIPVIFYNNDRTKRFKIVAEGITKDGRMLMIEKFIEPKAP